MHYPSGIAISQENPIVSFLVGIKWQPYVSLILDQKFKNFDGLADWPLRKSAFKFMISQLWWPRNEQTTGAADMAILERNVNWLKEIWSAKGGSEQTGRPQAQTWLVNYELSIDGLSSRNLKLLSEMENHFKQVAWALFKYFSSPLSIQLYLILHCFAL